jgi:ATP-dependent RNA helicase DeaD
MSTFQELGITPDTLNAIAAMGYEVPTPVQKETIPLLLSGRDVVVRARTGTGKTAAFGIPLVEDVRKNHGRGVVALVLTPTRELAQQVVEEILELARQSPLRAVAVYGGTGFEKQVRALRQDEPTVVVATPGRLLDHMGRGNVRFDNVRHVVLDEADRMLDMGFLPDVERILSKIPRDRQTGLYSATMPVQVQRVAQRFMRDPALAQIETGPRTTPMTDQFRIDVVKQQKTTALLSLLKREEPDRTVVFTRTKHLARRLAQQLDKKGYRTVSLQGNMSQNARNRALDSFRQGRATIMVATDVASRGLDVPEITHVINYDMPDEPEVYVHRIGRTARAGRSGRAFTFVQPDQRRDLNSIEQTAGSTLAQYEMEDVPLLVVQHNEDNGGDFGGGGRNGGRGRGRNGGGRNGGRRSRNSGRGGGNRGRRY